MHDPYGLKDWMLHRINLILYGETACTLITASSSILLFNQDQFKAQGLKIVTQYS